MCIRKFSMWKSCGVPYTNLTHWKSCDSVNIAWQRAIKQSSQWKVGMIFLYQWQSAIQPIELHEEFKQTEWNNYKQNLMTACQLLLTTPVEAWLCQFERKFWLSISCAEWVEVVLVEIQECFISGIIIKPKRINIINWNHYNCLQDSGLSRRKLILISALKDVTLFIIMEETHHWQMNSIFNKSFHTYYQILTITDNKWCV